MKGSFFLGADHAPKFEIRDMQFEQLGAKDVLVRTYACGVCGTDVHIYHGEEGSAAVTPPVVLGHEFAGVVEAVGSAVTLVKPGDHVAMDPNMYCGTCRPCRMGRKQNCEHLFALGVNVNGGFAEYCLCPETQVFKVDERLPFPVAAMAEPLACVVHGIDQAGIRPGQTVLVIGGGTIGQLMLQMARLSGASRVILSEPIALRRELALSLGADAAIDPLTEDVAEKVRELTASGGADVVIECVGRDFTASQAIEAAGPGATILLFGVPSPEARLSLPLFDVYKKELRIVGSMINPDTHERAVELLSGGRLKIEPLITHTFGLDHVEEAILMQMSDKSVKVMVEPNRNAQQ